MADYMQNSGIQYHIRCKKGDLGRYVILPGDPKRSKEIAKFFTNPILIADNREFITYTGELLGEKVSVLSTGIGGPSSAIALQEAVKCGADTFIRVGTAGGIDLNVKAGDLVVANAAIRQDGTSMEYAPEIFPAVSDFSLTSALVKACENLKLSHHIGVVQSKDSYYGQHEPELMATKDKLMNLWSAYCTLGVLASEMECSTLYIVGQYLHIRVSGVLEILGNQEREKKGLENNIVLSTDGAVKCAIEALKILIKQERK